VQAENTSGKPAQFDFTSLNASLKVNRGYTVIFGPVRASDIKPFIENGYKTTEVMRIVTFNFSDRIKLVPVDLVYAGYRLFIALLLILIISGLSSQGIIFRNILEKGIPSMLNIILAYITGIVITPILLPYIPVKMFAFKGLISGLILSVILFAFNRMGSSTLEVISWFLIISGISSFMAMNFTGASTFTSLSGVKKEMRTFVPVQISFAGTGLILLTINNLL
jgi:acetyl-CoA decarbonylase/synthase complex subunit gamma